MWVELNVEVEVSVGRSCEEVVCVGVELWGDGGGGVVGRWR